MRHIYNNIVSNKSLKSLEKIFISVCRNSIFFSLLLITLSISINTFAQDIEQLKKQAKFNNDPNAWYQLGQIYEKGEIEKVNIKKAIQYYEKAALQGHPEAALQLALIKEDKKEYAEAIKLFDIASKGKIGKAHFKLGNYYSDGKYISKDTNRAIYHYLRAWNENINGTDEILGKLNIENYRNKDNDIICQKYLGNNGNPQSKYALGMAYKTGNEVPKDLNKSFTLLQEAADDGNDNAQYQTALFYKEGLLSNKDTEKAIYYLLKSAIQGNQPAIELLSTMDVKTFASSDNMDYLVYKASILNDAEAQFSLFEYYNTKSNPSENDLLKKIEYCQRSALQDYQPAMIALSDQYINGIPPLQKSASSAFKWRRQAAYVGSDSAEYLLGNMYAIGEGVAKSEEIAIKWYMKAANHGVVSAKVALQQYDISKYLDKSDLEYATYLAKEGDLEAQLMLGKYYFNKNKVAAINWLNKAGEQKSAEAQLYLGDIYKEGKCQTMPDLERAESHYKEAIALGNQDAYLRMAQLYADRDSNTIKSENAETAEAITYASQYMTRSIALNSNNTDTNPEAYLVIADVQYKEEKFIEAIKQYDLYIKSFDEASGNHKEFIEVLNKQAQSYAEIDEINSALLQIDIALAKSDDFSQLKGFKKDYSEIKGELFYTQAKLYFKKGDKYKACNVFQKAKALGIKIESKFEDLCMN